MRDNPRTTVVSAVVGVVSLAGLFAFTVLVPELGDDEGGEGGAGGAESSSATAELPDRLGGTFVAIDSGDLPARVADQFGDAEDLKEREAAVGEAIDDVFGVPGAFRLYAAEDGSAILQATAVDKAPGYFAPATLPIDPATLDLARSQTELVKVDDAVCEITWPADVPADEPIDPAVEPQKVRCQLGDGDRTYEVFAQGRVSVAGTVDILDSLADA